MFGKEKVFTTTDIEQKNKIEDILSEESKKDMELHLEECENCKIRSACSSCGAIAYTETGRTDGKPEYMCKMTESIIEQTQLKYEELKNIK